MTDVTDTEVKAADPNHGFSLYDNQKILAEDQIRTEGRLDKLERNEKILALGVITSVGGMAVGYKAITNLMKAMTQIGRVVASFPGAAQVGMEAGMQEAERLHVETEKAKTMFTPPQPPTDAPGGGDTWDPGPQDLPAEVREALADESYTADDVAGVTGETQVDALVSQDVVDDGVERPRAARNVSQKK